MQKRNEDGSNGLLELGGNYDEPNRGKGVVKNSRAAGHANASDYFPITKNKRLPDPSYNQEYPKYKQEDIDRYNDLKEETLKREAVNSVKEGSHEIKGYLMNTLLAKTKADRKYLSCLITTANFLKRIIETDGISQSRIHIIWQLQEA